MTFRPATQNDERIFYAWRQHDENQGRRYGYYTDQLTTISEHRDWYIQHLRTATMLIWTQGGNSIVGNGTVRIDSNQEVSFSANPRDYTALLTEFKNIYPGKFKFTVDQDDPKADALKQAGMNEWPVRFFTT